MAVHGLGPRLRSLRLRQQRTLRDIAARCGFTVSLLSKIESNKSTPPVATLAKIAAALGVSLADLFAADPARMPAFTAGGSLADDALVRTDKGYAFHLLTANQSTKAMQPFLFVAERGAVRPGAMSHGGEEFIHVLSGRMKYRVGATTYTLGPGDSLYFDSVEEHDFEPVTATVRFLGVFASAEGKATVGRRGGTVSRSRKAPGATPAKTSGKNR